MTADSWPVGVSLSADIEHRPDRPEPYRAPGPLDRSGHQAPEVQISGLLVGAGRARLD
jgi:hypothetical protein